MKYLIMRPKKHINSLTNCFSQPFKAAIAQMLQKLNVVSIATAVEVTNYGMQSYGAKH